MCFIVYADAVVKKGCEDMREHMYRAWDEETKTMYEENELEEALGENKLVATLSYGRLVIGAYDKHGEWRELKGMQYIGRNDKNGKRIYEGDINGSDEPMYVVYQDGCFGLKFKNNPSYFDSCINWDQLEIIGDIYQNPELLEEQHV